MQKIKKDHISTEEDSALTNRAPSVPVVVTRVNRQWSMGMILCTLLFVICILLTITPLTRIPDTDFSMRLPVGSFLGMASGWFPLFIGTTSQTTSDFIELCGMSALACLCYVVGALLIRRQTEKSSQLLVRCCIWSATILAGGIFLVTPALLSHDTLSYAGYSRLLAVYHANPYFVTMSSFSRDPLTAANQWGQAVSVYGPIWMFVCGILGWLLRPDATAYVISFRCIALAAHLLNCWLIGRTLQTMGRSPRAVTLGMLLYAWNPLVLLESGLNGHNDVFMVTFILLGVLLGVHAEMQNRLLTPRGYLLPAVAFTLAVLVKFTSLPILAAYLLLLACKALRPTSTDPQEVRQALSRHGKRAAWVLGWSVFTASLLALLLYGPFWFGQSLHAIIGSFTNNTAASWAENSFMRSVIAWEQIHPAQKQNHLVVFLSTRQLWNDLNFAAIALCLVLGARHLWFHPTIKAFLTLALATMCIVLLLTPWFYPWYLTWIVGLAALCLPTRQQSRVTWALFALAYTFSFSAFLIYLFSSGLLGKYGYLVSLCNTLPPVCVFLLCWKSSLLDTIKGKS